MLKNMAFVCTTAMKIMLAPPVKYSYTAGLFYIIICNNSQKADTDMCNKGVKIKDES